MPGYTEICRDIVGCAKQVQPILGLLSTPTVRLRHPERLSACFRASGGTVLGSAPVAGS